jgi:nucleoside-diphosphate-sugar epimerase
MQILVTGGAGYVGSTLLPLLLEKGHKVRVMDILTHGGRSMLGAWSHPHFEFVHGDIRDAFGVRKALENVHAVVHLAAIVGDPACARQPELARSVNQDASFTLLEECQRAHVERLVFASTCSNYGKMSDPTQLVDETSELRPVSLYAETKVTFEETLLNPKRTGGLCATALRSATVYGVAPRMRFDLTVNEFTMELLTKKHLCVFGEQFWRPYVHVRDFARAILIVLTEPVEKVRGDVFNVGSTDQNFRKLDLVDLIKPYARDATVEFVKKNEDPRDYRVSFEKIKTKLGFAISRTVQDGIREVAHLVRGGVIDNFTSPEYRN